MVEGLHVPVITRAKTSGVPIPVEPSMAVKSKRKDQTERDQLPKTPTAE